MNATVGARIGLGLFFGIFLVVGAGMGTAFFVRPALQMLDALNWTSTTCEIQSSRVRENRDSDGSTYKVEVSYRYVADGEPHTGTRYKFSSMSTSGYRGKAETVEGLATGTRVACFVDPDDPAEAVIVRGPTGDMAFGIIPLVFTLVGAAGVVAVAFGRGPFADQFAPKRVQSAMTYGYSAPERGRFTRLVPFQSRTAKIVALSIVALFWNGVVSVLVYQVVDNWQRRLIAWPLALFAVPFVFVGLFLIVIAVRMMLEYFNPMPHLTVNSKVLALGEEMKLKWVIEGHVHTLQHLTIALEGREEATYRRGTDTKTDKETFASFPLVDQPAPIPFEGGTASVKIPAGTMHSFDAPNNKIVWYVKLHGSVANWPDLQDEFPIQVTPAR